MDVKPSNSLSRSRSSSKIPATCYSKADFMLMRAILNAVVLIALAATSSAQVVPLHAAARFGRAARRRCEVPVRTDFAAC